MEKFVYTLKRDSERALFTKFQSSLKSFGYERGPEVCMTISPTPPRRPLPKHGFSRGHIHTDRTVRQTPPFQLLSGSAPDSDACRKGSKVEVERRADRKEKRQHSVEITALSVC